MWDSQVIKLQSRVVSIMDKLKFNPPNCLLLEGGTSMDRKLLSLYWGMCLNCRRSEGPCFECGPCVQIKDEVFRDLYFLGSGDKIKINQIRELRTIYPQKPHFSWRLIVIADAQALRGEPANALLKSIEEPAPGNSFVLLAPQRESVFSTLVSRSFIITLNRQGDVYFDEHTEEVFKEMADFVRTGRGWLSRTSGQNRLDISQARQIVARCRHELIISMLTKNCHNLFHTLSPPAGYQVQSIFNKAENCLSLNNIRVDMVMEWLAVSLWKNINQREKDV